MGHDAIRASETGGLDAHYSLLRDEAGGAGPPRVRIGSWREEDSADFQILEVLKALSRSNQFDAQIAANRAGRTRQSLQGDGRIAGIE